LNKKSAIVSIVLIAVICGFLLPTQVKAFQSPSGANPTDYNYYGPTPTNLLITVFTDEVSEFTALTSGTIDMMDTLLTPTQYSTVTNVHYAGTPVNTNYVAAADLVQYDLNNYVAPFSNLYYREAFASLVNRTDYLDTYYPGGGTNAYNPLSYDLYGQDNSYIDVNTLCAALFPTNYAAAYQYFMESPYPLVAMNSTNGFGNNPTQPVAIPGYSTWFFASPWQYNYESTPAGGNVTNAYQVGVPNATIQIFARTEHLERFDQAIYMVDLCGSTTSSFTEWVEANYYSPTYAALFAEYPLPTVGGVPQWPMINFVSVGITDPQADVEVMTYYRYQMYTGAWILDEFMDALEIWQSYYTPQSYGWGAFALNYDDWYDINYNATAASDYYDYYVTNCVTAATDGISTPSAHSGSLYWANLAELDMMSQVPLITMFCYSGYSATLAADNYTINAEGTGFDNWYNYMDAVTPSGSIGWGWTSPVLNPNPISSTWAWDWYMMGPIYDSMLGGNPYNVTVIPALATNYTVVDQDPNNPFGAGLTSAFLQLRNDVFWQDVPEMTRTAYTYNKQAQLNGPFTDMALTPADVAFTYEYLTHDGLYQSVHLYSEVWDVGQVQISSVYRSLFAPYATTYNHVKEWSAYAPSYPYAPLPTATPVYVNNVPGYTWENITYIMSTGVLNGSYTGVYDFVNTANPFQPSNFIAFNPTFSPYQLEVNFIDTTGWFVEPFELSVPIIPMFIWANLAEASWPNSAVSPGFKTPSSFSMVLGPMTGGADLLFGSGPFIWTSGTATSYTLAPYVTGTSYSINGGPSVTEDTSYWAAAVREADVYAPSDGGLSAYPADNLGAQPSTVGSGGPTTNENATAWLIPVWANQTLVNWTPYHKTVTETITLSYRYYYNGQWYPSATGYYSLSSVEGPELLNPGQIFASENLFHVQVPKGAKFISFNEICKVSWTEPGSSQGGNFGPNPSLNLEPYLFALNTTGFLVTLRFPTHLPGDCLGLGVVNIKAGALVGANWGLYTPYHSPPGSANPLADINGDGVVNIKDGAIIGAEWGYVFNALS
jgi:hypothetical protein